LAAELERLSAENQDWLMAAPTRRLEQIASAGQDLHSGFAYDSQVDGGAAVSACLQGGHEAVVWVECESYAQIANHGRAWVDMQASPSFCFKVPEVSWGWRAPWWRMLLPTAFGISP